VKIALVLPALTVLALLAAPALADPITGILSIEGSDFYSTTLGTITFVPGSGIVGGLSTGTLAPFTAGNPITLFDFSFGDTFVPGSEVFSTTEGGITTTVSLDSIISAFNVNNGLAIDALATVTETGFSPTVATFALTTQDGGDGLNEVTFSATDPPISVAPEPSSVALLGTGLLGMAGLVRGRMKKQRPAQ
jgi:PEP-CTERM motif